MLRDAELRAETARKLLAAMQSSGRIQDSLTPWPNGDWFHPEFHCRRGFILPDGRVHICFDEGNCLNRLLGIPPPPSDPSYTPDDRPKFLAACDCKLIFVYPEVPNGSWTEPSETAPKRLVVQVYAVPTEAQIKTVQRAIDEAGAGAAVYELYSPTASPWSSLRRGSATSAAEIARAAEEALG